MPIYAYRCGACGHARDILQKLSDPLLTTCPACCAEAFSKQVTAAGFQLKGSGWYVTDFRDGGKGKPETKPADGAAEKPAADTKGGEGTAKPADGATASAPAPAPAPAPAASSPAPAPASGG